MKIHLIKNVKKLIRKNNKDDNETHKRYISRIILRTIIILAGAKAAVIFYHLLFLDLDDYCKGSFSLLTIMIVLGLFIILYFVFYLGYERFVSYTLIFTLFAMATYLGYVWGTDLPAEILLYVLTIVISGILIGSRFSFITTSIITMTTAVIGCLQKSRLIHVDHSWIYKKWNYSDIVITAIMLFIIATILWLFNRELKSERDLLETKVSEKTKELKISQAKEMTQFYRFAEFGKLSGGLFHDLVNPLTALMLNINKAKMDSEQLPDSILIKEEIDQAMKASEKMKDFIVSVRKQINFQNQQKIFSLNKEIEEAIIVLNYKTRRNLVEIFFEADKDITIEGDPIKFNQIVTNLLSNAIDAFDDFKIGEREISIVLKRIGDSVELRITDNGKGMEEKIIKQIFEPFFTTKNNSDGLGLGLSIIKKIVEESFRGNISVYSTAGRGSTFVVSIPTDKI